MYIMRKKNNINEKGLNIMDLNDKQKNFVELCYKEFGDDLTEITRKQLVKVEKKYKVAFPQWLVADKDLKVSKGVYSMPGTVVKNVETKTEDIKSQAAYVVSSLTDNVVPNKDKDFVSFGNYSDVKNVITSKKFYPMFITGLSGNGKTLAVTQACAVAKREMIRVNITIETDEDDLLGGYRLQDGQTVWQNGPVIEAMERGAILLLDEIDLASNKVMCLQPILEGNGVFIKKINKFVKPAPGFNVIATANTKGQGSDDGKFIGTNILNEAFLERFPITVEQAYPTNKIETKILNNVMSEKGLTKKDDEKFANNLITWADIIRKTFYEGGVDEIISTRRLVHIVEAYTIFKNKMKAIEMCTNRFDVDTKTSFMDLYSKVDGGEDVTTWNSPVLEDEPDSDDSEEDNPSY